MYFIVINPMSQRGQSIMRLPLLDAHFDAADIRYETHVTSGPLDGYEKTLNFCKRNPNSKGIIGVGGDGMMQEIVAGMADAFPESHNGKKIPIPLGILPSATSNDFMSTLYGTKELSVAKFKQDPEVVVKDFFETLMKERLRTVDVITANGIGFLNIGNIGIDAKIADTATRLKTRYAEHAYISAAYRCIMEHKNYPYIIETESGKIEGECAFVAACNAQYYGNGIHLAPSAKIDDGKITLCLGKGMGKLRAMLYLWAMQRGKHVNSKLTIFTECREVKITMPPGHICLDGNTYSHNGVTVFKVLPGVLDLFVRDTSTPQENI